VLLLNACLTVEQGQPASHAKKGWEALTDRLLALVASTASPCVYLLWGAHAQAKAPLIEATAQGAWARDPGAAGQPSRRRCRRGGRRCPSWAAGTFAQARAGWRERGVRRALF
jgi:uracil-DNA glycosylase